MKKNNNTLIVLTCLGLLIFMQGCSSYAQKKQAAHQRWDKTSARAKVSVAADLFENGRIEQAEKTIRQCLAADSKIAEAHLLLGRIQYVQSRLDDAKKSFNNAIELDDKQDYAWFSLGVIAQEENLPDDSLECYVKAMKLNPSNTEYVVTVAEIYAQQGNYEKALELLKSRMEAPATDAVLKVKAADIMNRMGDAEGAIMLYSQAMLLKPDDRNTTEAIGYCYLTARNWDKAAQMFEKLRTGASVEDKSIYLKILALCYMNSGRYGQAANYFDKLTVDDRNNAELWLQMGQAALGTNSPKRAMACAARAMELKPDWSEAAALKGCAQYLSCDYDSAVYTFMKITTSEKVGGFAWLMTGRCYQHLGKKDLADRAYQNAAVVNPDSRLMSMISKGRDGAN